MLANALTAVAAVSLCIVTTSEPASADYREHALFQNSYSQKCLEMPYGTKDNLAQAGQYTCYGWETQQWNYNTDTGIIQNVWTGKCLEVMYWNPNNYAPVGQFDCTFAANQQWNMARSTGLIQNRFSGKCLEVPDRADFAKVFQRDCGASVNQIWAWTI